MTRRAFVTVGTLYFVAGLVVAGSCRPSGRPKLKVCVSAPVPVATDILSGIEDWGLPVELRASDCEVWFSVGPAPTGHPDVSGYTEGDRRHVTLVKGPWRDVARHEAGHVFGFRDDKGWMDGRVFEVSR